MTGAYSDNLTLGVDAPRGGYTVEVVPGMQLNVRRPRLKADADYQLKWINYSDRNIDARTLNLLSLNARAEAVEDFFFVDLKGSVSRQLLSAFGTQGGDHGEVNDNSTEARVFNVSPFFRWRPNKNFASEARFSRTVSRTTGTATPDSEADNGDVSARLGGEVLALELSGSNQDVRYRNGRSNQVTRVQGRLNYRLDQELKTWISSGWEKNDFAGPNRQRHANHGAAIEWNPGARTHVLVGREKRYFGDSDSVEIRHRTPITVWKYRRSRDVSLQSGLSAISGQESYYDLVFAQLSGRIADPQQRADATNRLLDQLGIPRNAVPTIGFIANRAYVQKRQEVSFIANGARNTLTVSAHEGESQSQTTGILGDDFDQTAVVRQHGGSAVYLNRLTPATSLSLTVSGQTNRGAADSKLDSKVRSRSVGASTSVGAASTVALTARRTEVTGGTSPYVENYRALTLVHKF